ncbi:MAG: hypothetical protein HUK20_06235 [Fibrobacter sp.]|nr:hypothetical protein [Fibrobacter sp.]
MSEFLGCHILVADAYDAAASNRSYWTELPQEFVRKEVEKRKGVQFDPFFADKMIGLIDDDKLYEMSENREVV